MGRDSAANQSSLPPFACPSIPLSGCCNGHTDGRTRTATAATVFVRAQEQHQFHFVFFFAVVIFGSGHAKYRLPTTAGRTDGGTNRIAKDNDDDEGAFESPAFYRVTALPPSLALWSIRRSAVGKLPQNKECSQEASKTAAIARGTRKPWFRHCRCS